MDSINIFLISILSIIYARLLKSTVNWLKVDGFTIPNNDLKLELFCLMSWTWGMSTLNSMEGIIFSLLAGILFAIEFIFLFTALDYSTVTRVSLIFYTMPVWLTLAAHFLIENDKLNLNKILGLIIALAGLFLAVYEPTTGYDTSQFYGDAYSLLASLCWATIAIMLKTTRLSNATPETQLLYQLVISGIILLPISMQINDYVRNIDLDLILIFSFQVIVIMCMGFIGWLWIMSRYSASSTSSFAFLTPIFGVLFGWLIMDDPINEQIYLSLFFTCLGIYLINKRSSKLD